MEDVNPGSAGGQVAFLAARCSCVTWGRLAPSASMVQGGYIQGRYLLALLGVVLRSLAPNRLNEHGGFTSAVLVSLPLGWCINPLQAGSAAGAVPLTVAIPRGHRRGFSAFPISVGRTCFGWALPARFLWATTIVSHQRMLKLKLSPYQESTALLGHGHFMPSTWDSMSTLGSSLLACVMAGMCASAT